MNLTASILFLAFLTALFMAVGDVIAGTGGMMVALVIAAAMNLDPGGTAMPWSCACITPIKGADAQTAPELFAIVGDLAARAGLPMPKVYLSQPAAQCICHRPQPGAYCVLLPRPACLNGLRPKEVAGVMAHACAKPRHADHDGRGYYCRRGFHARQFCLHVRCPDDLRDNPFGFIGVLAAMIVAPFAAMLVHGHEPHPRILNSPARRGNLRQSAGLRPRPCGRFPAHMLLNPDAEANPATAHMFIVNPAVGLRFDNLFSTHSDPAHRIARRCGCG